MSLLSTAADTLQTYLLRMELTLRSRKDLRVRSSRHLALFAWALPPNSNAGVFRPLSFIKYGCRMGWQISAFHAPAPSNRNQHGLDLLRQIPDRAAVHTIPSSELRPSYRLTPQIDGGFCNALEMADFAITSLADSPPDAVLASGPPFHTFVAAGFVARHFQVPLILDYRDEWTECPFDFVTKHHDDVTWEKRCLKNATAVVFTTQSHIDHQIRTFPELEREKTYLVPNGWDADDFDAAAKGIRQNAVDSSSGFVLSHIGTLAGHNLPGDFLNNLTQAMDMHPALRDKLKIRFVGRRSPEADDELKRFTHQDNLEIIDHVDKENANRLMMESDALLLISTS